MLKLALQAVVFGFEDIKTSESQVVRGKAVCLAGDISGAAEIFCDAFGDAVMSEPLPEVDLVVVNAIVATGELRGQERPDVVLSALD